MIKKLKPDAGTVEIINKLNEVIDRLNSIKPDVYITPRPGAYDLNAVSKRLKAMSNTQAIKINPKEKAVLKHLLQVGESGWFTNDVLPDGVSSVAEAEQIVKNLLCRLNPNAYYERNNISNVSGVGIQKP